MDDDEVAKFRTFEHEGWESISDEYDQSFADLTTQSIPALLDAAGVEAGSRVLDVCSGPGYIAAAATERGAEAIGIDFSKAMVRLAQERYPAVDFREGDAEELPFEANSFDAVVVGFGILHLGQPEKALKEASRVLRPGGRFACAVWATSERAVGFGLVLHSIAAKGRNDVDLPTGPDFFRFSYPAEVRRTFSDAGFRQVSTEEVPQVWRLASADGVYDAMLGSTVRTGGLIAAQKKSAKKAIRIAIRDAMVEYRDGDGYALPMPAIVSSAVKPG